MAYKNDLQLAYSGREIATQRIEIIDSTVFDDQAARSYSEARRTKYQRLLEKSDEKIAEIKGKITEDIGVKKLQLDESKTAYNQVSTRYKLGEISLQECEKQQNILQRKYDRVKQEGVELSQLLDTSRSLEVGGQIPIDIDKEVDGYGNINRKMAGLNISSDIKMPNIDAFSNVKMPDFGGFSNRNVPNNISIQGLNLSRGSFISLIGSIGGLIAIFLPWIGIRAWYGVGETASLYGLSQLMNQLFLLASAFDPGSVPLFARLFAYYWIFLLLLLAVSVYFSVQGGGAFAHIGIGALQLGGLFAFFVGFVYMVQSMQNELMGYSSSLASSMSSLFQIEFGFYMAIIFAFMLIFGGFIEWKED
jgi:hypothetical protein